MTTQKRPFISFASKNDTVILDGSMGHQLFATGLPWDRYLWSALAIIDPQYHHLVTKAHLAYLEAGCDVIILNNYSLTPFYLKTVKKKENGYEMKALINTSIKLANKAVELYRNESNSNRSKEIFIAASIPPVSETHRPDLVNHSLVIKFISFTLQNIKIQYIAFPMCLTCFNM